MIIRVNKEGNWKALPNQIFEDENLTLEASGLMGYFLVKPDNWKVRQKDVMARKGIGRDKFRRIMKELIDAGYVEVIKPRDESGKVTGTEYIIHELPQNRGTENQPLGVTEGLKNRPSGKPTVGKTDRRKTRPYSNYSDINKYSVINKEEVYTHAREENLNLKAPSYDEVCEIFLRRMNFASQAIKEKWERAGLVNGTRAEVFENFVPWYVDQQIERGKKAGRTKVQTLIDISEETEASQLARTFNRSWLDKWIEKQEQQKSKQHGKHSKMGKRPGTKEYLESVRQYAIDNNIPGYS